MAQLSVDIPILLLVIFFSIPIYFPTRLIFFMQDYYSLETIHRKRSSFFTGIAAIFIPLMNAFAPAPSDISYERKVKLDDFSAADTLLFYDKGKFYISVFKTKSISYEETDSIAHAVLEKCAENDSLSPSLALRKDSIGYVITMTLPDNKARYNAKLRAPFMKLRNDIQKLFPNKKVRIYLGGYNDGGNIIAKLE
jgi:hypothetical protein